MSCSPGGPNELRATRWLYLSHVGFCPLFSLLPSSCTQPWSLLALKPPPSPANPLVSAPPPRWGTWKRGGPLWTPLLQRAPWGSRLAFPSLAVCGHSFSARHQGLKALCRLPCLETPSPGPRAKEGWVNCPSPRSCHRCSHSPVTGCPLRSPYLLPPELRGPGSPLRGVSLASAPAAFNGTGRSLIWVLLTRSPETPDKQSKTSEAELAPGANEQSSLPSSGSSFQGRRIPAFTTAVPPVNKHRGTNMAIWLLSEACWPMISAKRLLWRSPSDFGLAFYCLSGRSEKSR